MKRFVDVIIRIAFLRCKTLVKAVVSGAFTTGDCFKTLVKCSICLVRKDLLTNIYNNTSFFYKHVCFRQLKGYKKFLMTLKFY